MGFIMESMLKFLKLRQQHILNQNLQLHVLMVTRALHISLKLAGVFPGDEVIVPTLTFIAPINAVNYWASPVFIDADLLQYRF